MLEGLIGGKVIVQLKAKDKSGHWYLVTGVDFKKEELEPFEENMKRGNIAILEPGERVRVPFTKFDKVQVLQALASC